MTQLFRKGEIVWAKMIGFPWWPATIKRIYLKRKTKEDKGKRVTVYESQPTFYVEFYSDNSHAEIQFKNIEKFYKRFHEKAHTNKKGLLKAIELAKKDLLKNYKNTSIPLTFLYDTLGKKRFRTRKKKQSKGKITPQKEKYNSKLRKYSQNNIEDVKIKNTNVNSGNCSKKGKIVSKPLKVITDEDENENDIYQKTTYSGNNNSNYDYNFMSTALNNCNNNSDFSDSRTISIISHNKNDECMSLSSSVNESDNSSDSEDVSNNTTQNETTFKKTNQKIKCLINQLLRIKIEIRGKEAHRQIISCLKSLKELYTMNIKSPSQTEISYYTVIYIFI